MKILKNLTLAALAAIAITLLFHSPNVQASGKPQRVFAFTKWITTFPQMEGVADGGAFKGEVLNLTQIAGGQIWEIDARYEIIAGDQSFTAIIHGKQNWQTGIGVLNGVITEGWLAGAQVHVQFQAIPSEEHGVVFQGTITIMPNQRN